MKLPRILPLALPLLALPAAARVDVGYTVLPNGLKVMLYPNRQSPEIACRIFYVTGSVHEAPGRSGIAHMLEHMLFKGTKTVGVKDGRKDAADIAQIDSVMARIRALDPADRQLSPADSAARAHADSGEYVRLRARYDSLLAAERANMVKNELEDAYLKAGGSGLNAFTTDLLTAYFVNLPKNKLELFLWLESDRMRNAVLREFYSERDVVMEERRMRVEDRPTGRYFEALEGLFYEAQPYRFPTIGYFSDLHHLTREQAEEHYRLYYKPNNAILVLAGDIDTAQALAMVKRYFGPIPRGAEFPPIVTAEPEQPGEKRLLVRRDDAQPRLDLLFHTPGFPNDDLYALDVVEGVLSGQSGRLYRKLVKEAGLAIAVDAGNGPDKYISSFQIEAQMAAKPDLPKVEKAVWDVLDGLARQPISDRELQRVKNQVVAHSLRSIVKMEDLATELAFWEVRGGWGNINTFPENVQKVTPAQVQAVCRKYFRPELATVGAILPKTAAGAASKAPKDPGTQEMTQ